MADIDVVVQSFLNSGRRITVTVDEAATVSQLKSAISSEEGVDTSIMKLLFNATLLEDSDTLDAVNIVDGSFINTSNNISQLATKENKQVAKLDLSALIRSVNGNPRATYDITQLPTRYSGNNVVVNPNEGGLVLGRPWTTGAVTALFVSLGAEFEIVVDDTTGISPGMVMTGADYSETVTVVTVNSSTLLTMSIIAPDTLPAPGTVLTFTNP